LGETEREAVDDIPVFLVVVRLLVELARATRTVAFLDADLLFSVVLLLLLGARARRLLRGRGTGD
jgi:hypothetical protein